MHVQSVSKFMEMSHAANPASSAKASTVLMDKQKNIIISCALMQKRRMTQEETDIVRNRHSNEGPAAKAFTKDQECLPNSLGMCFPIVPQTSNAVSNQSSLLAKSVLQELPVIMMLLEVTANAGQRLGTLIDLASDTNYTHAAASRFNLRSEEITLIVHGVGGMEVCVETKRYLLKI